MCDPSFIPFSGTRITIMPLQLRLKVIKGHWTLFQGHNIISKSRILILKMIGPSNTYTLAPWAPLNWKKCCLVIPCAMCPLPCLLWYSDDSTRTFHVAFFARGHSKVIGCHSQAMLYSNAHTPASFSPTTNFDHLNCAEHSAEHVYTSYDDPCPSW